MTWSMAVGVCGASIAARATALIAANERSFGLRNSTAVHAKYVSLCEQGARQNNGFRTIIQRNIDIRSGFKR